ncbi:MAG: ABC transporter permease [Dysgonamonadaceae bacterium]|jgi:ABC-2 type transport system permease protein|nr:ABC transporter permease [Dysgonamonadaceae bacterium]
MPKISLHSILQAANRETARLLHGRIYWFCILIAPVITWIFFLSMMCQGLPTDLPVALVDLDNSSVSRELARQLDAFEGTQIVAHYGDFGEARKEMQEGKVYGIFFIPRHFSADATAGKQTVLSFYTNNSYLIAGSLLFKDMKTTATLASGYVLLKTGLAHGQTEAQIRAKIQPVVIDSNPIGNPWLNYSVYLNNLILPGILALLVMCVTVYSIGIEIKEKTVKEWLAAGRFSITGSILGKLIPQTIFFFLVGLLLFVVLYLGMQFPVNGSLMRMAAALFCLIIASQALGVFMIGCFPTLRLGLSFACIWGMLSFSIAGFSFPVNAMYPPVQALSNLFPLRHYFLLYVDQALNGRDLFYSWTHYIALLGFLLLPLLVLRHLKWSLLHVPYQP